MIAKRYDILAFSAHPDDLEAVMGGTATKLAAKGRSILFVVLSDGEPTRYGQTGERTRQVLKAASILGVDRHALASESTNLTPPRDVVTTTTWPAMSSALAS
jgi:LmbE family N-acetylglucosaminyl deacetylase